MLQLHEQILSEIIALSTASEPRKRPKHARWHSIETLESVIGEKATHAVRRSLDVPWFGKSKQRIPLTAPRDAANVAKVFERMVWLSPLIAYLVLIQTIESSFRASFCTKNTGRSMSRCCKAWAHYPRRCQPGLLMNEALSLL